METCTVEGWMGGVLMVEECSIELEQIAYLTRELEEEGYVVRVIQE